MEPRFGILPWTSRICAGAAVVVGVLLLLPPSGRLRKVWYRLALWIAAGTFAVRWLSLKLLASSGNTAYFNPPLPLIGCVLMIEMGLACYIGGIVRRPIALAFLSVGLLLAGLQLAQLGF